MYYLNLFVKFCHYLSMEDNFPKIQPLSVTCKLPNYGRFGHRAIQVGQQVLILGGFNHFSHYSTSVIRFNLQNYHFQQFNLENQPGIQGFSAFYLKGLVYVWGGNIQSEPSNSLRSFDGCKYTALKQTGNIPAPRAFHASIFLANRYLLIFGGFNKLQIFNDWFLFDAETFQWKSIKFTNCIAPAYCCHLGWANGRGFLLTSETVTQSANKISVQYQTLIHQFRILDFRHPKIQIDKLTYQDGPPLRAQPSFTFFNKYIFLMGGQRLASNSQTLYDDIWCFNLETLKWKKYDANLNTKFGFDVVCHQNKMILIGGVASKEALSSTVQVLTLLSQRQTFEKKICQLCETVYAPFADKSASPNLTFNISTEPNINISISLIYKLSQLIKNPLQAVGLLVDNAFDVNASLLSISLKAQKKDRRFFKEDLRYLQIFDNSKNFTSSTLIKSLYSFCYIPYNGQWKFDEETSVNCEYSLNLKLAALRLGRSCLFVTETTDKEKFVIYFSVSSTDCPESKKPLNCFYYRVNGKDEHQVERRIIKSNVSHIISEKDYLNTAQFSTKVYVLEVYDLDRVEDRKDLLYQFGNNEIQLSLYNYLSHLYLPPLEGKEIRLEGDIVRPAKVGQKFVNDQSEGCLRAIDCKEDEELFKMINLYKIETINYNLDFIYIYHQGRFITTLTTGERNICGVLQIPDQISVNILKTQIEKSSDIKNLKYFVEGKENNRKRSQSICGRPIDQIRKRKQLNN